MDDRTERNRKQWERAIEAARAFGEAIIRWAEAAKAKEIASKLKPAIENHPNADDEWMQNYNGDA